MTDFFTQARTFYGNLEPARQTQLWLAAAGLLVAIIGVSWWMSTTPMQEIHFATQHDMQQAASRLSSEGVTAEVRPPTTIAVPVDQAAKANGLIGDLHPNPGLSEGDKFGMGQSPGVVDWLKLRQLQAELARQIAAMPGIASASVAIQPGERALFRNEPDIPGTASVMLNVSPSSSPAPETVRAIASLVANARTDLGPLDVSIVDSNGFVHQDGTGEANAEGQLSRSVMALKRTYEKEAEAKIARHLRGLVGVENAFLVAATAEVETQRRVIRSVDYNTDKTMVVNEKLREEAKERTEPEAEGTPGVDANQPERAADAAGGGAGRTQEDKTSIEKQTIAPRTDEEIVIPAGTLKRLAVSVSVDEAKLATVWGITPEDPAWAEELAALDKHLKEAAGLVSERQDSLSMMAKPFAEIPVVEPPSVTVDGVLGRVAPFVPYAIAAVALILAFLFVVRPLVAQVAKAPLPQLTQADEEEALGPDGKPRRLSGDEEEDELFERVHRMVENFQPVDKDDVNRLVQQQSDATAKVVRDWMKQGA